MHKCVVCSNSSSRTKYTRPEVIYHTFPRNEYRRKKWLKMYGIDRCYDWHRICSDHFLPENYKEGGKRSLKKNTVPQPYDENGFPSNVTGIAQSNDVEMGNNELLPTEQNCSSYTTQSNDVETSTNDFLPREQNRLSYTTQSNDIETSTDEFLPREQNRLRKLAYYNESDYIASEFYREVQNAVINNFESPRRSCRKIKLTTTNEDMSYENMPRLQTERFERQIPTFIANESIQTVNDSVVVPVLTTTKDHTLGNGVRCSVKNCFNRYSKDLSFFGYPNDFSLRKKWIEKCGLQVDPTKKVKNSVRVCRVHFEDNCFMNTERKNRLRPDAIPSLFLDGDARNIPSTSSSGSSRSVHVNKPSPVKKKRVRVNKRSSVNNGFIRANKRSPVNNEFIRVNKPSCSSTNYVANIDSNETPLLVYIDSTTRTAKDFQSYCCVPGCITNSIEEEEDISLFAPAPENIKEWSSSLYLDLTINSLVCERHFRIQDILRPNLLVNGINTEVKSLVTSALPVPIAKTAPKSNQKLYCSIPKCFTNTADEYQDISIFAPQIENVNEWSSILGFQLTLDSLVCERHFRPQDILRSTLMVDGNFQNIKSLAPFSMPKPLNDGLSTSYSAPLVPQLETNDVPVLKTYNDKFKRHKLNKLLRTKRIKKNVLDKSIATTNKTFSSKNENKEYSSVTNDTHEYNSTSGLDSSLKSNIVQTVDLSIVKIEPLDDDDDDDSQTNLETETEQIPPTLITEQVEDDNLPPLSSIDDSLSISLKKLKNISANSSLSVTLEPVDSSKITKPSEDFFSKVPPKSSMSITLRPKNNFSTINNSSPSVSLTPSFPSNSSSSVYDRSQQSLFQYETSPLKMSDKLSSDTVTHPEFINSQYIYLKPIPPTNKPNSTEFSEINTPVISNCISLAVLSDTHDSNLDNGTNTSECIIIDDDDTEEFIEKDNGFIYEISKSVILPSVFWKSIHDSTRNSTVFYQENLYETLKTINFDNSLLPKIQVYGTKYKYNKPIRTKNELQNLLEKIDNVEKCSSGIADDNCIGYYDKFAVDDTLCTVCQKKYQEFHEIIETQTKTTESLEQKISERTAKVLELRENMENIKINPTPTELLTSRPTSLINSMSVCRH